VAVMGVVEVFLGGMATPDQ